ncbi:hypothetical protein ACFYS8_23740 [Kitasatospora sp. NPDC004615]|uniref:hypothetical protein n=1 Tax=Kitasatospora sp. NPDC004615 TaxID=3364017 RepID=UPI0036AFC2DD
MLEENAQTLGLIADISDLANRPKNWLRGRLHRALVPGSLIRVTAPTQIIEFSSFVKSIESVGIAAGDDGEFSGMIAKVVRAMYGEQPVIRSLPCGLDQPEYRFTGIVTDPAGYISKEREALFSRLGADAQAWTMVASVSRIPDKHAVVGIDGIQRAVESLKAQLALSPDKIDRGSFESMVQETGRALESMGISEAPSWPAISVIPLAVYRSVLPVVLDDSLTAED